MSNLVLVASSELKTRLADVEAVLGGHASVAAATADIVAFWGAVPDVRVKELAAACKAAMVGFEDAPLSIHALNAKSRPLGYRLTRWSAGGTETDPPPGEEDEIRRVAIRLSGLQRTGRLASLMPTAPPSDFNALAGTLVARCAWLDPYDRVRIGAGEALDFAEEFLGFLRRDAVPPVGLNITVGKRRHVQPFLTFPAVKVEQHSRLEPALAAAKRKGAPIVVWASWRHERAERRCAEEGIALARMEDGFLRSVGLGAAFVRSLSLVVDGRGIYYDPSRPSDLEHLLQEAEMDERLVARGTALREAIVAANLTKYNVGRSSGEPIVPAGKIGVLVPGQVEDDASILRGASSVRTNLGLIRAARQRWPDAFILYKPHPDVEAGYRIGKVADPDALAHADRVVRDRSIVDLFAECRQIETMTSLAGFEGLLRGLQVATHGQPFYAGWGLTEDLAPNPRRSRARSLDELVAAALVLYPRYVDPISGLPCGPEIVLRRLAAARADSSRPGRIAGRRLQHGVALLRHRLLGPLLRRLT